MNQIYPAKYSLQVKFQKVCRQIETLLQAGKAFSFQKVKELLKRRDRYARQLLLQPSTILKAGGAFLLASTLTVSLRAQSTTYVQADSINPVRRAGLPQNLHQPTFVDIDGDGDLDCFETEEIPYPGPYFGPSTVRVTFLRNKGTKKSPKYVVDSTTFPKDLGTEILDDGSNTTKLQFVDIDGDGDYDLFAGNQFSADYGVKTQMLYYKNIGTAKKPKFIKAEKENPLSFYKGYYQLQFSFADFDKDGDYDLIVTDLYGEDFYKNTGTAKSPQFAFSQEFRGYGYALGPTPRVCIYDYNKDGRTDLFNTNRFRTPGTVTYYRNETASGDAKFKFVKDVADSPKMPSGFETFEYVDINNDGVAEAFTEDGHYAVATSASAATGAKEAVSLSVIASAVSVKAYPNPFTNTFVVSLGSASSNTVIRIADLQGRVVSAVKANSTTVQLGSELQKGVYFVQVIQDTKVVFTQKVIKQ